MWTLWAFNPSKPKLHRTAFEEIRTPPALPAARSAFGLLARQHLDAAVAPFVTFDGIYSPIE